MRRTKREEKELAIEEDSRKTPGDGDLGHRDIVLLCNRFDPGEYEEEQWSIDGEEGKEDASTVNEPVDDFLG